MYLNMHALLHTKNDHRGDPPHKRFGGWVLNKESIDKKADRREEGHLRALQQGEAAAQLAERAIIRAVCRRGDVLQQQPCCHVLACRSRTPPRHMISSLSASERLSLISEVTLITKGHPLRHI